MPRRDVIRMTEEELTTFLAQGRTVICASTSATGRPHLMPLWYVPDGHELLCWTYAASQKAANLRRDPRATLQIEAGKSYEALRGVMIEADVELVADVERTAEIGLRIALRYAPGEPAPEDAPPELRAFIAGQAPKRVAMRFIPTRVVSWDHRKLGGRY
jgi:nitroimidazol reductase NimA-like FMN-containing flavoprotein (pyridoxamine 5'-phosphate oxidase superfamily)